MFYSCEELTTIPELDTSKVTNMFHMFRWCDKLTNFGGLVNIGQAFSNTQDYSFHRFVIQYSPLTYQSCMNVINNLYDVTLVNVNDATLTLSTYSYSLLSPDDIAIATNKGWTVESA
jgi:surface protein